MSWLQRGFFQFISQIIINSFLYHAFLTKALFVPCFFFLSPTSYSSSVAIQSSSSTSYHSCTAPNRHLSCFLLFSGAYFNPSLPCHYCFLMLCSQEVLVIKVCHSVHRVLISFFGWKSRGNLCSELYFNSSHCDSFGETADLGVVVKEWGLWYVHGQTLSPRHRT